MMQIDLCRDLSPEEQLTCETMEMDLDETTMSLLARVSKQTGQTPETVLENALLDFIATLQTDYVSEL